MIDGPSRVAVLGALLDDTTTAAERARLETAGATVTLTSPAPHEEDRIVAACAEAEVALVLAQIPFSEGVLESLPRLALLQQCTVGYDRVDVAAATRLGIMVANSPVFCLEEVSDHAAMLILACVRGLAPQLHAMRRHGWNRPAVVAEMPPLFRLRGRTVGFVGFGRIARRTAEKLSGFGARYLAFDPYLAPETVRAAGAEPVSLEELCRASDVVSMHALLNAETRRMFGEKEFRAMKPTACFVNTARGGSVDEAALVHALRERWIAGAGLDVLEIEPPAPDHPLLRMPNVLLTAHTAGTSADSMADNRWQMVEAVVAFLGGAWPSTLVNPEVKPRARARGRLQP